MLALPAALHLVLVPVIFVVIARSYFAARGARRPLPVALAFAAILAALHAGIIGLLAQRSALLGSVLDMWLPILLAFAATWATGAIMTMIPTRPAEP